MLLVDCCECVDTYMFVRKWWLWWVSVFYWAVSHPLWWAVDSDDFSDPRVSSLLYPSPYQSSHSHVLMTRIETVHRPTSTRICQMLLTSRPQSRNDTTQGIVCRPPHESHAHTTTHAARNIDCRTVMARCQLSDKRNSGTGITSEYQCIKWDIVNRMFVFVLHIVVECMMW